MRQNSIDHDATPHGLGGYYYPEKNLDEQLNTIVPRIPHEKDEEAICIF
jgi:hypothetical protein